MGYALRSPRYQTCPKCGAGLIIEDGKYIGTGFSPFTADEVDIKLKDEKKAKDSISKLFIKILKSKNKYYIEDLAVFAEIYTYLSNELNLPLEFLNWTGELLLLDIFAKKFSINKDYWTQKIHQHLKENIPTILDLFKITLDGEILGRETLYIFDEGGKRMNPYLSIFLKSDSINLFSESLPSPFNMF